MVFASMPFLWVFFPFTITVYYLSGLFKKIEIQNVFLLLMSLVFYAFGEPKYIFLLIACVFINYTGGLMIDRTEGSRKKLTLFLTVLLSLGMLIYFKYAGFLMKNIFSLINSLGGNISEPAISVMLPIGISFYTFQALSYVIDLYRGKCRVQRSFYKLLLYISFFPQLIAGPIVRYSDVADQIDRRTTDIDRFAAGAARFIIGLGKKVILANTFASKADIIFSMSISDRTPALAWAGIILYAMQIYFDFSGYSDMAIGMGKMFGFDFLENFDLPYIATSITEFWRRWHISLSTWFKEYLYIPLGGNRKGPVKTYLNIFTVFFVTGLWHGAGWTFILWGVFHGIFRIAERAGLEKILKRSRFRIINHIYTLSVVLFAWVLFRADNITEAFAYYGSMFGIGNTAGSYSFMEVIGTRCLFYTFIGILLCGIIPGSVQKKIRDNAIFKTAALPLILIISIVILASDSYNPFIYFRF